MVWHKHESKNLYDAFSVLHNPMRPGLIGLEERLFKIEEGRWRFIVEFVEIVDKAEIVGMVEKDISFFHTTVANVVDLIFRKVYFSSRHIFIL